jgi:hypothetical protein
MKQNHEVTMVSVFDLKPYEANARTHSDEQVTQLMESIKAFGFNNPILVQEDLTIVAGHGRLMAAQKLGLNSVPVITLKHLTAEQARAYVLADNKLALNADWDQEMLGLELSDLRTENFDLNLTGFNGDVIEQFLNPPEPEEASVDCKGITMADHEDAYDKSIVRQIVLIYSVTQYDSLMDAIGDYAEKNGLSNNTEVINHLLETNGYAISKRTTKEH